MREGSKVTCIDDGIKADMILSVSNYYQNWVKKGNIYTIRQILNNDDIVSGVLLEEVRNKPIYIDLIGREQEPAFGMFRFRELDEMTVENVEHYVEMI